MTADIERLASALAVPEVDRDLLRVALTHRSILNEDPTITEPNERLEFLGDAVIDLAVSDHLYQTHPERAEGQLTTLRAAVVRAAALARVARGLSLGTYLRISKGEDAAGGRSRPSLLAGGLEAIIGAVYLDLGWETAQALVDRLLVPELDRVLAADTDAPGKDPKSLLQELAQAAQGLTPTYQVVSAVGPDHAKEFKVEVRIGHELSVRGAGPSKQRAEQAAAQRALERWRPAHTDDKRDG
ncbi:MAG: ribonuclease III [Dehalococcoidia bacterium]|nr:ribonuclease III [Dehalococcoidia bacterium]